MEFIEDELKTLKPMSADNLIMEGVQMLDEWPLIKKVIPAEDFVFEPISLGSRKIEVSPKTTKNRKTGGGRNILYLSETEVNLLKYINGRNSVTRPRRDGAVHRIQDIQEPVQSGEQETDPKKEKTANVERWNRDLREQLLRDTQRKVTSRSGSCWPSSRCSLP